jgi:hypothetical protein
MRVPCCGAPFLRIGWVYNLLVQLLLSLASAITLGSKSRKTHEILLSHLRLPQPEGSGSRIYFSTGTAWPSYTPGTGSLFDASYDSQGYGGGTLTRLRTGYQSRSRSYFTTDQQSVSQYVLVSSTLVGLAP